MNAHTIAPIALIALIAPLETKRSTVEGLPGCSGQANARDRALAGVSL